MHPAATTGVSLGTRSAKPRDIYCAEPIQSTPRLTPERVEEEQEHLCVIIDKQLANI